MAQKRGSIEWRWTLPPSFHGDEQGYFSPNTSYAHAPVTAVDKKQILLQT
jgi:hypothetical protein